ncbi:MFS transporter [Enterobacter hormaechei]|uniref:MFS transporter n=1 Tax=Enterobacter hormaechei TaxID=158836 RepID=UPI001373E39F|nr:MFS transporter [Enterobacter hormaechei]QHO79885.1 MFS transporter [Enterobacter hormaechei]QHO96982.1 MFS transporter [Enterobacter hormaechei]
MPNCFADEKSEIPFDNTNNNSNEENQILPKFIFSRLSILMLLEFFVFGSWFTTMGLVLYTHQLGGVIGLAYTSCAIAAILSPLALGAIGDRFISSEKVLGVLHILGGILQFVLPGLVAAGENNTTLLVIFLYMLCFQPTLGLVNSLSFHNLGVKSDLFPFLRLFATGGWVVAGVVVGMLGYSSTTGIFYVAGVSSILLGLYSFTLPRTEPQAKSNKFNLLDALGAKSFVLFRHRGFAVLMACALLTSISLGFYNTYASPFIGSLGIQNVAAVLALGQLSEIIFIISVPFVIKRIGMKWALLVGMSMWGIRFVMFILAAKGHTWTAVVGVGLHGICNDFFLIISAMYIDKLAPAEMKVQAQSWLIIAISGFGAAFGSLISGTVYSGTVDTTTVQSWILLWTIPIGIAVVTSVIWLIGFKEKK